ncbi:sensor histidine kinase [Desulfotomaculum copahuensis]|uniref:histidine kinase n=1 Tax=Desulfotomaculum copahuensis TaxID=1838280 RepID=A0A1B7LFJ9_9FIRM|nr:sensor histidine kinase KdpD [Desulfotomaculum copahuensis]OAT82333.1 two-component sensor histidine kinase [Desulfotomaculum copahuensis]
MEKEKRVDPEALLASLDREDRGKLTVFLGAAAGVGKTYAMLEAARDRLAEGVDVVAGWVETHGRAETEALLKGLTVVPPRHVVYKDKEFQEMDLDALLARRPTLALVDELAHTNIPGSRHVRRYQDVEELLAAGINVYTTLNIQHLESVNDVVAQVTGVQVRETVPDRVLESARVQVVDIPPEELVQRLKEGKVYVPGQAREALKKFFRPGNINALRELALRYAARRVDRQKEAYMRLHGIAGPWPSGERVMVCVSPSPFSARLIRIARRMAESFQAEWLAVYVETPRRFPAGEAARDRLAKNLRLAEELGAEIVNISGSDVAEELLELAQKHNVSQIVIGKPLHSKFWEWTHGSVVDRVIRHSRGISIHVIPGQPEPGHGRGPAPRRKGGNFNFPVTPYLMVMAMVIAVVLLAVPLKPFLGLINIAMIFLLPVLFSAVKWGRPPAIAAAALAIITFDFFLVPPVLSFSVADIRYIFSFVIFLLVALFTGTLSTRLRQQVESARTREVRTAALYSLSRDIAAVAELAPVLDSIVKKVSAAVDSEVVLLLPAEDGKLELRAGAAAGGESSLDESELAVADWSFRRGQRAGRGTDTLNGAARLYLPLRTEQGVHGVLGIRPAGPERHLPPEQVRLLEAFAGLAAVAVNRVQLTERAKEARVLAESERLRTALFNSLSHDLRTPLASIIGAVTGLLDADGVYGPEARRDLLQTIRQGAMRMNRFVSNLLDMARLESGLLSLNREWCDIQDIIGVAVGRLDEALRNRPLKIDIQPGLPLVRADFVLIEQVLVNLLDNALKYSSPGSEITISVSQQSRQLAVAVADRGPAVPEGDLERIFDKFYRLRSPRQVSGTGLGLAICRGIIEAHGGRIWAANIPAGGVMITFVLPLGDDAPGEVPDGRAGDRHGC